MEDCIFCKIVAGDIPNYKIYEDQQVIAFLDVFPRVKGHTLVIPKEHHRWVADVPAFGAFWETARVVAQRIQQKLNADYISFVTMGEEVPHAHIHILPQQKGSIAGIAFKPVIEMSREEIGALAKDLSSD